MNDVSPVPPLPVASVPPSVTAPVVGEDGVRPVEPPEKDVTPLEAAAAQVGTPPAKVKT